MRENNPSKLFPFFIFFLSALTDEGVKNQDKLWETVYSLRERGEDGFLKMVPSTPLETPCYEPAENIQYRPGYVYLLESELGYFKIGRTKNLRQRHAYFGLTLPFKVKLVAAMPAYDAVALEQQFHILFRDYHVNGEWFKLDEPLFDFTRWFMLTTQTGLFSDIEGELEATW